MTSRAGGLSSKQRARVQRGSGGCPQSCAMPGWTTLPLDTPLPSTALILYVVVSIQQHWH